MPEIGVVVVTWNSEDTIEACLRSIPAGVPVVVVDNASEDETIARAQAARAEVRVLAQSENRGFGVACNLGARALGDRDILLLNPDAALGDACLEQLAGVLAANPEAGVVGPRIQDLTGHVEWSWGTDPSLLAEFRRKHEHRQSARPMAQLTAVDWVTGGCCLVRRAAWDAVGGFDEGYFLYFEDLDLCRRIRQAGFRVLFEPSAMALHVRGVSARRLGLKTEWHYRSSQLRYYGRHSGLLSQAGLRAYLGLKFAWRVLREPSDRPIALRIARLAMFGTSH